MFFIEMKYTLFCSDLYLCHLFSPIVGFLYLMEPCMGVEPISADLESASLPEGTEHR